MKKIKTTISLLSLASACSIVAIPALASCSTIKKPTEYHILNINDIHGAMAGYGEEIVDVSNSVPGSLRIAREVNKIKKQHPKTVLLSAGDENSGDCWSVCDHAGTTYPILKAMGVRYAAVGNHAFEWGRDDLASGRYDRMARTDETEGNYFVASNILESNDYQNKVWCIDPKSEDFQSDFTTWCNQRVRWADPYKIINFGNANVCLIGLATQNTLVDGNKKVVSTYSFIDYNASIHYTKYLARQELGAERFNQIDSFILLTHCDSDYEKNVLSGEAPRLAGVVDTDIDAIISAHSHKVGAGRIWNNKLNKAIWMAQGGSSGKYLVDTKLTVNPKNKPGKRITDVSMSLHKIPIPETLEAAQNEWNELQLCEDKDMIPVVDEYARQKAVVEEKISETVAVADLNKADPDEVQEDKDGKLFDGYYNGLIDSGVHIGHAYYDCKNILDHLGGWACRAQILGYCIQYWNEIQEGSLIIPSAAFLTQDSLPANIKNGGIKVKDMFALQPYDNYAHIAYLNIFQLANIINYSLAGNPETAKAHGGKGFSYTEKYQYEPDLTYFNATSADGKSITQTQKVALNLEENGKPIINSGYTCGIMPFYGIRMNLVKIDDTPGERDLKFTNPVTGKVSPVYDSSATYRLKTHEYTTKNNETVILPDLWVYDGEQDGKGTRWGSIERSDDPTCYVSADEWYEAEHAKEGQDPKLIPVIFNSFNYGGGNTQTRMIKQYANYNILNYGIQFYTEDTPETIRDFITLFCKTSNSEVRQWAEYTIPTNITWKQVKDLIDKPN